MLPYTRNYLFARFFTIGLFVEYAQIKVNSSFHIKSSSMPLKKVPMPLIADFYEVKAKLSLIVYFKLKIVRLWYRKMYGAFHYQCHHCHFNLKSFYCICRYVAKIPFIRHYTVRKFRLHYSLYERIYVVVSSWNWSTTTTETNATEFCTTFKAEYRLVSMPCRASCIISTYFVALTLYLLSQAELEVHATGAAFVYAAIYNYLRILFIRQFNPFN